MKEFTEFVNEGISIKNLPKHIVIGNGTSDRGGFRNVIATIEQKLARSWQELIAADDFDKKEFGKDLKSEERLVRVTNQRSKPDSSLNMSIAKINVKTGIIRFVDNKKYENNPDKIVRERGLKVKWINVEPTRGLKFFGIK